MIVSCLIFFLKNFLDIFNNLKLKSRTRTPKKILIIFSAITLTPTLLIAFFSIFIFDAALSGWFNKKFQLQFLNLLRLLISI